MLVAQQPLPTAPAPVAGSVPSISAGGGAA